MFNRNFGSEFRTHAGPTMFMQSILRYSDIYTSRHATLYYTLFASRCVVAGRLDPQQSLVRRRAPARCTPAARRPRLHGCTRA